MKIIRHRLTDRERQAVCSIVGKISQLAPDESIPPESGVSTRVISKTSSDLVKGHCLDSRKFSIDFQLLEGLKRALSRLRADRPVSPLAILENLPIESNAPAQLLLMGSLMGEVDEYSGHGSAIVAVSDRARVVDGRPSSSNNLEFKLHTDMSFYGHPPAFIAFLMLRSAEEGGESTFCDPLPIIERLPEQVIAELRRPFGFPAPPHMPELGLQHFPVIESTELGKVRVRYRRDGLIATSENQASALEIWSRNIEDFAFEVHIKEGEMAVFSNTQMLHGRRAFRDSTSPDNKRLALRAYIDCQDEEHL